MAQFSMEVKVGLNLLRSVESVEYLVAGVELPVPVAHAPAVLVQPLDVLDVGLAVQQPLGPAGGQYKVTIDASNVKQHHSSKSKRCHLDIWVRAGYKGTPELTPRFPP